MNILWLTVFISGVVPIIYGLNVMNIQEPIETRHIWTYVPYSTMTNAANLSMKLTAFGTINALEPVNASIDLDWFAPALENPEFSIYFWGANPIPLPSDERLLPYTSKIDLDHDQTMPERHFCANTTIVWTTSGIFGATVEETNSTSTAVKTYNVTQLVEIGPSDAPTRFRETKISEGFQWLEVGLVVALGSTFIYELSTRWGKGEISKKPDLDLLLIDPNGNTSKEIIVEPSFEKQVVKTEFQWIAELPNIFGEKKPEPDLVPIGIEITNIGENPAYGIRVFLRFPTECELLDKHGVTGGLSILPRNYKPTSGGLHVDEDNKNEARAWIDELGNDLMMNDFDKIYVRFPQKEQNYKVTACLIQNNYPPKDSVFTIRVRPKQMKK